VPPVHPTAVLGPDVRLAADVVVGPFTVIDGRVTIGPGTVIGPHCQLLGELVIGRNNRFHAGCVIGDAPQHTAHDGTPTRTEIGDGNTFREHVTVHRAMPVGAGPGTGVTKIGNDNYLMANAHVAHDCRVGDGCVFANGAVIGGHAEVGDRAFLSGNSAVHQFCRVGRLAMLSGTSAVSQDLPPFWVVQLINVPHGVNVVGMRRAGCSREEITAVREAYKLINKAGLPIREAVDRIAAESGHLPAVRELVEFVRASKRGITTGRVADAEG
jgi:UDP-N-acetylglucosamine acyltransferase